MAVICPTILATSADEYAEQLARVQKFAARIQIDLADGKFAPNRTITLGQIYLPRKKITTDIHLMYTEPYTELMTLISLKPQMVIIHAEASGDLLAMIRELQNVGVKTGVALLPQTPVSKATELITMADHVLIFAGDLGHFGGTADMSQLTKIPQIREIRPEIEIGWDGGVNDKNATDLINGGVDVLNVGGYIQKSLDPTAAFQKLQELVNSGS